MKHGAAGFQDLLAEAGTSQQRSNEFLGALRLTTVRACKPDDFTSLLLRCKECTTCSILAKCVALYACCLCHDVTFRPVYWSRSRLFTIWKAISTTQYPSVAQEARIFSICLQSTSTTKLHSEALMSAARLAPLTDRRCPPRNLLL